MTEPAWVVELREAARGKPRAGVELARGSRPKLLEADGVRALTSVLLAAFIVAAAVFRTRIAPLPFDLMALVLRTAAVAFVVRALIAGVRFFRSTARAKDAPEHVLAWSSDGIYERLHGRERWLARDRVVAVRVPEAVEGRSMLLDVRPVYVVPQPEGRVDAWELPSHLAQTSDILAARLTRWLETDRSDTPGRLAPPPPEPSARYERAARGQLEQGEAIVPEGFGYRLRAPYASLLGVVFALDALRVAGPFSARLIPAAVAACLLAIGFVALWFAWMRKRRASRLGIAMLLTREELLVRGPAGVVSVPWAQLATVHVQTRLAWSPFVGSYVVRVLHIDTLVGERLSFDAGFLGVAPDALAALLEAYKRGAV